MIKIFPIKHWRKYNQLNRFFIIVGIITVLGFLGFIIVTFSGLSIAKKDIEPLAKQVDIEAMNQQLIRIENDLNNNLAEADTVIYSGYSVSMMAMIYKNINHRQAYVFDIGNDMNKERLSLYINKSNDLCFRIIDSNEEIRTITINSKTGFFRFNYLTFITCEYGEKNNKSFQRILINGKEVEKYLYSSNLRLAKKIKLVGSTIGADLKGKNCSTVLLKANSIAHTTFTKKEVLGMMNIIRRYLTEGEKLNLKDFGYLNCDYYFKVKQDTNLEKIKIGN